jgi:hypothetical protein
MTDQAQLCLYQRTFGKNVPYLRAKKRNVVSTACPPADDLDSIYMGRK